MIRFFSLVIIISLYSSISFAFPPIVKSESLKSYIKFIIDKNHYYREYPDKNKKVIGYMAHGPIIENADSKYAIEYLVEVTGSWDPDTYDFTPKQFEFFALELPYCDFQYKNHTDYRFLRENLVLDLDGNARRFDIYSKISPKSDNNARCGDMDTGEKETVIDLPNSKITDVVYDKFTNVVVKLLARRKN
ncbi:MAG: hypothetical protein HOO06_01130 [Bdellovibrionaceae bacterium]|jgi:hypothetical protein|nr:hypothetical protein [Pseudobdellovibrionaceae bacterium]